MAPLRTLAILLLYFFNSVAAESRSVQKRAVTTIWTMYHIREEITYRIAPTTEIAQADKYHPLTIAASEAASSPHLIIGSIRISRRRPITCVDSQVTATVFSRQVHLCLAHHADCAFSTTNFTSAGFTFIWSKCSTICIYVGVTRFIASSIAVRQCPFTQCLEKIF